MKLELSKLDASNLIRMIGFSESVLGYMNDYIDDPKIAARARRWSVIKREVFKAAYEQGQTELIDLNEGEYDLSAQEFETTMTLQEDFEALVLHQKLANKLAWRDFYEAKSPAEIKKMAEDGKVFFGAEIHPYEQEYWNEFERHEYSRLRIVKE